MVDTKQDSITYSIVVPVYNSEQTLPVLYTRLVKVMESLDKPFEIVCVEDCGRDNSWQVLQNLAEKDTRVCAVQLMYNSGQASATMCGLRHAKGRFVITIDDDLQNPPEEIPVLIEALEKDTNCDVVIGIPQQKKHAWWRNLGSQLVNTINSYVFKKDHSIKFAGFRVIRRLVVNALIEKTVPHPAIGALLYSITPRIKNVYVRHDPRTTGRSGYTLSKIFALTLSNFLAFSDFPLRFLAGIGLMGIAFSLLFGLMIFIRYLMGGIGVPGWVTQVLLLVGLSGFNFFAFGVVGEYLLRILQSVYRTPQYIIRQRVAAHEEIEESVSHSFPEITH